jgi:hypothetical protein
MKKQTFSFEATGRKLFATEKVAVKVFTDKYAPGAAMPTDKAAQFKMGQVRLKVQKALSQGKPVQTAFYTEVQMARKALAGSAIATAAAKPARAKTAASGRGKSVRLLSKAP